MSLFKVLLDWHFFWKMSYVTLDKLHTGNFETIIKSYFIGRHVKIILLEL